MATSWCEIGLGQFQISLRVPLAGRLLGVPFAAVGLWFLYQMLASLFEAVRTGRTGEIFSALPGALLLLLMAVAFGLPGFALLCLRTKVVVDQMAGEIREVKDFRFVKRAQATPLSEITGIRADREETQHKDGDDSSESYSTVLLTLSFVKKSGSLLTAGIVDGPSEARRLGAELSRFTGLPLTAELGPAVHPGSRGPLSSNRSLR
jgi:hypothetical protein